MVRSRSLETKLRLDIGRNEFKSVGLRLDFLRSGRTMADFWLAGNLFCTIEALHIEAMIGTMYSQTFLSNHVGIGSRGHCLDGDFLIVVATSSTDTGSKTSSGVSAFLLTIVHSLMFLQFCASGYVVISNLRDSSECILFHFLHSSIISIISSVTQGFHTYSLVLWHNISVTFLCLQASSRCINVLFCTV